MPTALLSGQTLLFIGDSITDCDRHMRDVPLGVGYVRMTADLLAIREPAKRLKIINRGIGGQTIANLRSRWADHVLAHRPDWLVVKIGINDLHCHLGSPEANPKQSPEQFAAIYEQIISITRDTLPSTQILLISPFYASTDTNPASYRAQILGYIAPYIEAVRATAARHDTRYLALHDVVQELLRAMPPDAFAEDAIHPTPAGALFIAEQIYEALSQT